MCDFKLREVFKFDFFKNKNEFDINQKIRINFIVYDDKRILKNEMLYFFLVIFQIVINVCVLVEIVLSKQVVVLSVKKF